MAVDTRNKRFSLLGLALVVTAVLPNPDGAIDSSAERQQYLYCYSGIDAQVVSIAATPVEGVDESSVAVAGVDESSVAVAGVDGLEQDVGGRF